LFLLGVGGGKMNKTKTAFVIISIILLLGVGIYYIIPEEQQVTGKVVIEPLEKVKIGYRGHLFYLPAYVAQAKGFYKQQGLDAELIKFESTNQLVEAVLTGDIDAGVGGVNALVVLTIEQKEPGMLKIFNVGDFDERFEAIMVKPDSDIKTVQDLKGKTLATHPGGSTKVFMENMLEKEGLEGEIDIIQASPSQLLNILASDSADAVNLLEPSVTIAREKGMGKVLVQGPICNYFMNPMPFTTSVFSTEFVEENPKTADKISKAIDKAHIFINNNPSKAKSFLSDFTPVGDELEQKVEIAYYHTFKTMPMKEFQEMADKMTEAGLLEKEIPVESLFLK